MSFVYDIAEIPNLSQFVYDVKILYQLKGYKVKSLNDLCAFLDSSETEAYHRACQKLKSHIRSYCECGISIQDHQVQEVIPQGVLDTLSQEKQRVVARLFSRFPDEQVIFFYERFFPKLQCLHKISRNLGLKFNFVGTKTGRLSFKSNTFNPYVLPRDKRSCIKARPGYKIYQYDLKSSQPRIAIFSTDDNTFRRRFEDTDDIYSVFPGDREANKLSFLRWMYSANYAADERFGKLARPIKTLREVVFGDSLHHHNVVYNRFGRPLFFSGDEPDNVVFQNWITSTEADALYEILFNMQKKMAHTQSRILFPFYDAIICEIADEEKDMPLTLKQTIEENYLDHVFYCKFPVEMKSGANFGALH
jgi:hypothetical protein